MMVFLFLIFKSTRFHNISDIKKHSILRETLKKAKHKNLVLVNNGLKA